MESFYPGVPPLPCGHHHPPVNTLLWMVTDTESMSSQHCDNKSLRYLNKIHICCMYIHTSWACSWLWHQSGKRLEELSLCSAAICCSLTCRGRIPECACFTELTSERLVAHVSSSLLSHAIIARPPCEAVVDHGLHVSVHSFAHRPCLNQ